ncbi:DUF3299 domain-containing protein [Phaeobacter marinintestinus]|uniref:DUF3299 domain-containing protein n=1 Tax=Falsiphaeobacter marinintestinus TaxID=1492905 RepID=UPI001FEA6321|nr:DUF3299 domain-containing protein [Phaeobacter marinintestinus]
MQSSRMSGISLSRRDTLLGIAALPAFGVPAFAEAVVDLTWDDLLPNDGNSLSQQLRGFVQHDGSGPAMDQPISSGVRTDWNGQTVRLPGYVVPLDYSGDGVTAFILVPYVGACIHVPPPPANQLVLVTAEPPYQSEGVFEPVYVTGMFGTAGTTTQLAEVGYALSADKIEPFQP